MKPTKHKTKTILPPQYTGNHTGAEAQAQTATREEALLLYREAKARMLDINRWHRHGSPAEFLLTDAAGNPLQRPPQTGDLIRIDLPGPGTRAGKGYDWVAIEEFDEKTDTAADTDFFAFRVRPVAAPTSPHGQPSHFYTDETTSTFLLQRVGTRVTACEKGRNEIPNTHTPYAIDNVRNAAVAAGATLGLSILQWKALMQGWLQHE